MTATLETDIAGLLAKGYRPALVAGHDDGATLRVVYLMLAPGQLREIVLVVPKGDPRLPSLARLSFPLGRFERELHDLFGIVPEGHPLPHRLIRHGHWPRGWYPMRADTPPPTFDSAGAGAGADDYPFTPVDGNGVYEIPVGPIHAGLIEPGHFRFSVVGETIIRMKARLWFVHKGIEKLFEGRTIADALLLSERISGDTAVGHSLALTRAIEAAAAIEVPPAVEYLRAALLELERIYNHIGDLGALCNDVGYGALNQQALALKERLLRHNERVTGHRLLRSSIAPGIAQVRELPDTKLLSEVAAAAQELTDIALSNSIVRDRFTGTSVLQSDDALAVGTLGPVARASGIQTDARIDHSMIDLTPWIRPFDHPDGDVLARFRIRAHEIADSVAILRGIQDLLTAGVPGMAGALAAGVPGGAASGVRISGAGSGLAEGWRGTIAHRVELDVQGRISRVKIVDPSFFNWPALPLALTNTIVPDFPLTNKSFNLSYAGNDL